MYLQDRYGNSNQEFPSQRDVNYRCGSCGYELNLRSSDRNTSAIGSKYGKSMKRGIISFFSIDDSRFTQMDEFTCVPDFISKNSLGLLKRRTKLLCCKCGNYVGNAYEEESAPRNHQESDSSDTGSGSGSAPGISIRRKYNVKIRALQPSSSEEESGIPLVL
ncbi:hypothetical protein C5167_026240 [Papaver somniferum]|uniref:uncharacterized protein At4g08330, chloroplastic-like n=1 Tax=Papaver somniferum TaxID=3469 RepID=UPI000E6FFE9B|nr:uncharacterized protein At4g08330, chloroplastic-like [Papaver somniferum]RZC94509.1 hypothetical protein C5167_026240 [Papaver somniferum]